MIPYKGGNIYFSHNDNKSEETWPWYDKFLLKLHVVRFARIVDEVEQWNTAWYAAIKKYKDHVCKYTDPDLETSFSILQDEHTALLQENRDLRKKLLNLRKGSVKRKR